MLATSLSFLVQRTLVARARYPRLYESQVESRLDSPVHQLRIVQGAFRLLEGQTIQDLRGVSLPDLSNLLRHGRSIGIHGGKGRIFSFDVESADGLLVGRSLEEAFAAKRGLVPIAVVREEEVLPPGHAGPIEVGDRLLIAANDEAYADFTQAFGQTIPGAS
jgi:hypothetical protein